MNKVLIAAALVLGLKSSPVLATAERATPLDVVASFSVLGDMVKEIGGNNVKVSTIVGPNADAHTFEPAPQAVQLLGNAQVLVSNGLGFETWLPRLIASSGFSGLHIIASDGATLRTFQGEPVEVDQDRAIAGTDQHKLRDHGDQGDGHAHHPGDVDPHAWLNLENGMIYAENIAEGLALADPSRAPNFQRRVRKYLTTMEKLDAEIKAALADIPKEHRKVVIAHDAFGYFGDAYDVTFIPLAALGDAAEPSAKDLAVIIDRIRAEEKIAVFPEKISNPTLIEQLGREGGITVGGPLYSDALDTPDEPAGTYLGMFHWNAGQLISVLKDDTAASSH